MSSSRKKGGLTRFSGRVKNFLKRDTKVQTDTMRAWTKDEVKKFAKGIGNEIMNDHAESHNVLINIMDNVGKSDKDGNFTITYKKKTLRARQLG